MDKAKVLGGVGYRGAVIPLRTFSGAAAARIVHPPGHKIDAHAHDWPVLALYRIGAFQECGEEGVAYFDGPSAVFHPPGAGHEDEVAESGLETISIAFDPAWLGIMRLPQRTVWLKHGAFTRAALELGRAWISASSSEQQLRMRMTALLDRASNTQSLSMPAPAWLGSVTERISQERASGVELARLLDLHPAWLARAYRAFTGEGIADTRRRRRVERAAVRLRHSEMRLADIAIDSGFCDQSYMNRDFKKVLGLTPLQVRAEKGLISRL